MDHIPALHDAIITSFPRDKVDVIKQAYAYAASYMQRHQLDWEKVYAIAEGEFSKDQEVAANDNEIPPQQTALQRRFGGDKDMAAAVYWLYLLKVNAEAVQYSLLETHVRKTLNRVTSAYMRDSADASDEAAVFGITHQQDASARYALLLAYLGVAPEQAKLATRALRESLVKAINEHSPAARR